MRYRVQNTEYRLVRIMLALAIILIAAPVNALDYPHTGVNNISCSNCHYVHGNLPDWATHVPQNIDDTQYNNLCWSCHNDVEAPYMKTHSSLTTSDKYGDADNDGEPGWSIECKDCHDPHQQRQFRTYGSESYLYSGTSTAITSNTITSAGAGWTPDEYAGLVVVPNVNEVFYNYQIVSNTEDTLTIKGTIDLSKVSVGDTFAIVYGKLIDETIPTPNSGDKAVRFFRPTGSKSFADGDTTYDGICEVCHIQTLFHRNNASGDHIHNAGADCANCHGHAEGFEEVGCDTCHGYPPIVDSATGGPDGLVNDPGVTGSVTAGAHDFHVNTKYISCSTCHYNSIGAGTTHNNSLTITLGFWLFGGTYQGGAYDGQSGVNYDTTSTTPITSISNTGSKTCSNIYCHSTGQSVTDGNDPTPVYASPVWDDPLSAVCGSCHKVSEAMGLTSGSHAEHLGSTGVSGCGDCHTGAANDASSYNSSNHVNGSIDVANDYTAGGTPGNGYGTCSTASCHDDGTGTIVITPTWGTDVPDCTACHSEVPNTGSHQKHVVTTTYKKADCADCHDGAVKGTTPPAQHLDGNLDVYDSTPGDLGYPLDVAKGGAPYDSCSTAYCHSTGQSTTDGNDPTPTYATVTWGDTVICGDCHKVSEAMGLTSGSHAEHLGSTGVSGCGDCHTGAANDASSYDSITHVDGIIDVSNSYSAGGTPGNGYGTCSTASCHDDGTGSMVVTPIWGSSPPPCTECHDATPTTGSHSKHLTVGKACGDCHDGAVESTTAPEQHQDGNIDVYDAVAGDLGYPIDKAKGSAYASCSNIYCHGNYNGSGLNASPTWGDSVSGVCGTCHGASNTVYPASGSHERHAGDGQWTGTTGTQNNREYSCTLCHKGIVSGTGPASYTIADSTKHVNQVVDWEFDTTDSRLSTSSTYSIASGTQPPSDGTTPRTYGTCSNIYCHSNVQPDGGVGSPDVYSTPTWGTETKCYGCHTDTVTYPDPNNSDQARSRHTKMTSGSHSKHIFSANPLECLNCHDWAGLTMFLSGCRSDLCHGGTGEKTYHVNGSIELIFGSHIGPSATYNGTPTPGDGYSNCTNIYCHSDGTSVRTGDNTFINTTPDWGGASLACNSCHGNTTYPSPNDGMPIYPNGSPKENSHKEHVIDNGIECGNCHWQTTQDGMSISNPAAHTQKGYSLWPNGSFKGITVSFVYAPASVTSPGSCNAISCHGGNNAVWGATLTCGSCHLGSGDVDDYAFNNGTMAMIDSTEWSYSGHGKASGTYDVSGNIAANLSCDYCHDESVPHETATNPFRLANYNVLGNGWNDTCYICHKTGSLGYDPGAGLKNSTVKIDKYHYGSKHGASNDGGSLCWDCHDPHGDRTSGSGNIYMIHSSVTKDKSDAYGTPALTASPSFTAKTTGTDYAKSSSPFDGICNVCHTTTDHYTSTSGDGHNSSTVCTNCHFHSEDTVVDGNAFAPSGDCITCHAQEMAGTRRIVTGASGDFVKASHHVTDGTTTEIVTEEACKVCHGDLYSIGHPGTAPTDPLVELMDQDSGIISTYDISTDAGALEPFCVSCHDSDGSLQNGVQPFNTATGGVDMNSPVDIGWTVGSMAHSSLTDKCFGCHGDSGATGTTLDPFVNAHGSDSAFLLRYNNYTSGASQTFCYNCHDGTVSSKDIWTAFGLTYNHAAGTEDCQQCHDQHGAKSGLHVAGSTNLADMIGGVNQGLGFNYQYEICFQCHNVAITKTDLTSEIEMDTNFNGGGTYQSYWSTIPDIQSQFSITNYAYHPLFAPGRNQPDNSLNSEWDTSDYRKDDTAPGGPFNGLDNNFVDGWVSTSLVTCSDCHDNSGSGARGPHGSAQPWILKGMDTTVSVTTAGAGVIYPNQNADLTKSYIAANFCVNCHRADVYGWGSNTTPSIKNQKFSRVSHLGGAMKAECTATHVETGKGGYRNIGCMNCHGGGEVGGIHGSNLGVGTAGSDEMGKRFMNGNSWRGHTLGSTETTCYTGTPPAIGVNMSSCSGKHGAKTVSTNYSYAWE
jgi:predicted CxxxxCH...CXXCH cytochrome family protein